MILALDTSSEWVCVGLGDADGVRVARISDERMHHAELLAPMIAAALDETHLLARDLTQIVVGVGPGPYTGLRVGLVTARTLGYALGIPVVGVCSLDAIAAEVASRGQSGEFAVATDARRKEVYFATYDAAGHRRSGPDVEKPGVVATSLPTAGRGSWLYREAFPAALAPPVPSAVWLIETALGRTGAELLPADPLYLRRPDAQIPAKSKAVS